MSDSEIFCPDSRHPQLLRVQPWLAYDWLAVGFTTRLGGQSKPPFDSFNLGLHVHDDVSDVLANRIQLCRLSEFNWDYMTCADQVHGSKVYQVTDQDKGKGSDSQASAITGTDALYTDRPGILLTSFYADCVPLYFLCTKNRMVGLAHAGWRGTARRIGTEMVQTWYDKFGISPQDVYVLIGPSIGLCCYEVGQAVIDALQPTEDMWSEHIVRSKANGQYDVDLKRLNVHFLVQAGIPSTHIEISSWCTSCSTDQFYSYRKAGGQTGRMASYIGLVERSQRL